MLSITPVMSAIFLLAVVISPIVCTTCPTTTPPCVATSLAELASWLAARAVSALFFTVLVSCSIDAAVCCRFDDCSSVRCERSALPVAICADPVAMLSELCRTWPTIAARLSRMTFIAASKLALSPSRASTCAHRLPLAISLATATA